MQICFLSPFFEGNCNKINLGSWKFEENFYIIENFQLVKLRKENTSKIMFLILFILHQQPCLLEDDIAVHIVEHEH